MGEHRYSGMTVPAAKMTGERRLPWDFLLGSAAALILISVARLHAFFPLLAAIRPALITTAVAVVALLGSQQGARRVQHLGTPLGRWMAAFVVWAVITAPFGIYIGRSVSYLLDQFLREAVVILVVAASVRNVLDLERLLRVYGFGVIAFSVLAAGTGSRHVGGGGYDANDSAMFIVSGMPIIFYFLVRARKGLGKASSASASRRPGRRSSCRDRGVASSLSSPFSATRCSSSRGSRSRSGWRSWRSPWA